jgi:hypothetical protein
MVAGMGTMLAKTAPGAVSGSSPFQRAEHCVYRSLGLSARFAARCGDFFGFGFGGFGAGLLSWRDIGISSWVGDGHPPDHREGSLRPSVL